MIENQKKDLMKQAILDDDIGDIFDQDEDGGFLFL